MVVVHRTIISAMALFLAVVLRRISGGHCMGWIGRFAASSIRHGPEAISSQIRILPWLTPALLVVSGMASMANAQAQAQAQAQAPASPPAAAQTPLDASTRKAVIEGAIAKLTANYVFPEKVPAIANVLRRKLASGGYDTIIDPAAFAKTVSADMEPVAHDRHLHLIWSATARRASYTANNLTADEMAMVRARDARVNYLLPRVEVLPGNIGYLKIDGFLPPEDAGATLAGAMAFLRHSDALIFDLRDCGGGDPTMVAMVISYLVPPETQLNAFHQRGSQADVQSWTLPYVPGGRWSTDKPAYVLTSKRTASAGEEFSYDLQQLKRATIIGEPTWGGANPGGVMNIDQHFAIWLPTGAAVNPISGKNWEGDGVKPDVAVDPAQGLETARHLAVDKLLEYATEQQRAALLKLRETDKSGA
jgi:hypothetical protein